MLLSLKNKEQWDSGDMQSSSCGNQALPCHNGTIAINRHWEIIRRDGLATDADFAKHRYVFRTPSHQSFRMWFLLEFWRIISIHIAFRGKMLKRFGGGCHSTSTKQRLETRPTHLERTPQVSTIRSTTTYCSAAGSASGAAAAGGGAAGRM